MLCVPHITSQIPKHICRKCQHRFVDFSAAAGALGWMLFYLWYSAQSLWMREPNVRSLQCQRVSSRCRVHRAPKLKIYRYLCSAFLAQCSCALVFSFFYYPVFEFYIYVNWERIESEVLCTCCQAREAGRMYVRISLCRLRCYHHLSHAHFICSKLFISAFRQRDHVQLSLTMRINCTLVIIFLCTLLHSRKMNCHFDRP